MRKDEPEAIGIIAARLLAKVDGRAAKLSRQGAASFRVLGEAGCHRSEPAERAIEIRESHAELAGQDFKRGRPLFGAGFDTVRDGAENGIADLRGKTPNERARLIIEKCAHPKFHDALLRYAEMAKCGQTPQTLAKAFAFHEQFLRTGDMSGADL